MRRHQFALMAGAVIAAAILGCGRTTPSAAEDPWAHLSSPVSVPAHTGAVNSVAWRPDGKAYATAANDGTVQIREDATGTLLIKLRVTSDPIIAVAWRPDGAALASASEDGTIRLWDPTSGKETAKITSPRTSVSSIVWRPDGKALASGGIDNLVRVWEMDSGKEIAKLEGPKHLVYSVAWRPDGKALAAGVGADPTDPKETYGTVLVWDTATGQRTATLGEHFGSVATVAWRPDGKLIASAGYDAQIRIWEPETGKVFATLKGGERWVRTLAWSPNGGSLLAGSEDGTIRIWDLPPP